MPILLNITFLTLGFLLLAKGATWVVQGASSLAARFGVSDMVVGLTVVALGTSAPELFVSTLSAVGGNGAIAVGNVLGSNIANIFLVLGLAATLRPIAISKGSTWREIPFCLATAAMVALLLAFANEPFLVSRPEAGVLLLTVVFYFRFALRRSAPSPTVIPIASTRSAGLSGVLMLVGLACLVVGADLIVRGGVRIAEGLGVDDSVIAVTIIAIGTSLPEMATSVAAALKGKCDIAVGNVVGSNILNSGLVLGVAGLARPIQSAHPFILDAGVGLAGSLLLFAFMFTGKKHKLDRWEGVLCLLVYVGYIVSRVAGI